jgi:predicted ester cyclase
MKKSIVLLLSLVILSCTQQPSQECQTLALENTNLNKNLVNYVSAWEAVFEKRDINLINTDSFDAQVTVVTAQGDIEGIDAFRAYYNNYLTGFSDAEFKFIDVFGQGDKIVKHWNFKGTHDGELFGIPATNNKVDLSGTTLVWMKDGKVIKEQDFFDNHSFLTQLGLL